MIGIVRRYGFGGSHLERLSTYSSVGEIDPCDILSPKRVISVWPNFVSLAILILILILILIETNLIKYLEIRIFLKEKISKSSRQFGQR